MDRNNNPLENQNQLENQADLRTELQTNLRTDRQNDTSKEPVEYPSGAAQDNDRQQTNASRQVRDNEQGYGSQQAQNGEYPSGTGQEDRYGQNLYGGSQSGTGQDCYYHQAYRQAQYGAQQGNAQGYASGGYYSPGYYPQNIHRNQEPLTISQYLIMLVVLAIPVVNLIMLFIWGFSDNVNLNKRNFARAELLMMLILFGIAFMFVMLAVMLTGLAASVGRFHGFF